MTALSIFSAADKAPDAPGLITGDRTYTFAMLADAAQKAIAELGNPSGPVTVIAHRRAETFIRLHALIAANIPALILHPRLAPAQKRRAESAIAQRARPNPDALAILLTSGSAGAPKIVELSRAAFIASAEASARNLGWRKDDRWLCALPLAHVGGLSILSRCVIARKPVILDEGDHFDAAAVIALARRHRATLFSAVPTMLEKMAAIDPGWHRDTALRAILIGGARAPAPLLQRLGRCPVVVSYGMTETCSQIAATRVTPACDLTDPPPLSPLSGTELRLDDAGQIFVRGPTVTTTSQDSRWLATGDRGSLDEHGRLMVFGRADDIIITGGENVDPREVEDALLRTPGVSSACVFGIPDPTWGQVVAAAVAGNLASLSSIRDAARNLAPHQHPRLACVLDAIPLNDTGKIDRAATARRAIPYLEHIK